MVREQEAEEVMDKCAICGITVRYPDRIHDEGQIICIPCWNGLNADEQYSEEPRLGDGHRGERST